MTIYDKILYKSFAPLLIIDIKGQIFSEKVTP